MRRYLAATVAIVSILTLAGAGQAGGTFSVRLLNKDSVAKYDWNVKLEIKLEVTVTLNQELQQ